MALLGVAVWPGLGLAAEDLAAALQSAPTLAVERVCAPIRSTRGGEAMWFPNPDGKSYDVVIRYYEKYIENTTFAILDLGTGEIRQELLEKGGHSLSLVGPDGKGYGHGMGGILVYDPASNRLAQLPGAPYIGGETKPMVVGLDGMIYGTGSKDGRAQAYRIDPKTGTSTDFGLLGPSHAPNPCWGYSMAVDDRFIYVVSGKIPWYLVAYDRVTKEQRVLLTLEDPEGIISVGNNGGGVTACVRRSGGKPEETYWLDQGATVLRKDSAEAPPAPGKPAPQAALPPKPEMQGDTMPMADGTVSLRFAGKQMDFKIPTYPATIYQITALPDGRICGSGGNYLGLFIYDPKTGQHQHLGKLPISVPIMAWQAGRLYMTGYPRAKTLAYDPASPWGKENPISVGSLGNEGSGIHEAYCLVAAADGRVYVGGGWYRNGEGGGLGWWDPKEKKAGGTSEGLGNYRVTHLTTAGEGRYVVLSTKAVRDQAANVPAPAQARIFVYDTVERKMRPGFETLKGAIHTGAIAGVSGTRILAFTLDPEGPADKPWQERGSVLYAFDALDGKIAWQKKIPFPIGFVVNDNYDGTVGFDFKLGPDGRVWTYTGGKMIAVNPEKPWGLSYEESSLVRVNPEDGAITVVGKAGTVGRMAFLGKDLYLTGGSKYHTSGGEYLRRIRGVAP